jgi:hypothetical protein
MANPNHARVWLRANNYADVAGLIDEVMDEWRQAGVGARRNWWDILAGTPAGQPRVVAKREFPILRAAQIRQEMTVTPNAICRNEDETPPPKTTQKRWEPYRSSEARTR